MAQNYDGNVCYRVIVSENVTLCNGGEYFVKGMIIDEENKKKEMNEELLFIGDKDKMAERNLLITDGIVKSREGYIWVKIYMLEGGNKSIHTGTTLGYAENFKYMMIKKIEEQLIK
ncbi:MAG: hypothetical protein HC773_24880 [Scytonema sp. CRU_2_7]|nr:hypothetical protein [Scytonema sp. CRU_2_7]